MHIYFVSVVEFAIKNAVTYRTTIWPTYANIKFNRTQIIIALAFSSTTQQTYTTTSHNKRIFSGKNREPAFVLN